MKKVLEAVEDQNLELAEKRLQEAQSAIDKAVVKGVIHRNTGARRKSRLTLKVKALYGENQS
jgi:small subunit ribosomal protein S20